ncbi:MAG TPA: ADP-glyceromanno-heptose 6-epimerase [Candidatus Baltobacteraceae bacterium]|nr:ADP-glyceromanno-heptose 6-epimerase [Candidatus Baltobacteraceae bacterium]
MKTPILVTGGAGFIGSAVVWELNRAGTNDVVVCDVLDRTEKWKNLVSLRFRDYIEAADLAAQIEQDSSWIKRFGTVLHLGACSSTTETDSAYLMRNNFGFTKMLAEAAVKFGIRFVYASSAATYGSLEDGLSDTRELDALRPLNMYAYSKQLFDTYAQRTALSDRILGLKYFNVYGPNEGHKGDMRSVVSKAFDSIRSKGCVQLFKSYRKEFPDGGQLRDFIYVKDAVRMTVMLAADPSAMRLVNVGSGNASTWLELANAVFTALDIEPCIEFIDMPEALQPKYQYRTQAVIDRARSFGAVPQFTLEDGIADYVRRYLACKQLLDPAIAEPKLENKVRNQQPSGVVKASLV